MTGDLFTSYVIVWETCPFISQDEIIKLTDAGAGGVTGPEDFLPQELTVINKINPAEIILYGVFKVRY